ncbi:hypothetical protein KHQ84_gp205 [Rhodococcus phage Finch]|uniref:Uncharacterized protein n=1 Tax=Rhodococcus phage Finch TaxID=2094144 RepID=A0A2P1JXP3_9CAUD|nr:hypothetical protein KHQ84_gp205 [Rhodococcus phage Finch]AVO25127.1 hypothetical protein SEA_FINCH_205 [Rhodococcus phage Finch]
MSKLTPAIPRLRAVKLSELGHIQTTVFKELVKRRVASEMFCPTTGEALDVRTSIAVVSQDHETVFAAMSRKAWAALGPGFLKDPKLETIKFYDPKDQ